MSDHGFKIMVEHANETVAARDAEITRLRASLAASEHYLKAALDERDYPREDLRECRRDRALANNALREATEELQRARAALVAAEERIRTGR